MYSKFALMDKKIDYQKSLVRNTEQPLQKCKVSSVDFSRKLKNESSHSRVPPQTPVESEHSVKNTQSASARPKFDNPELYSTLKMEKKIENIVKSRVKSSSASDKKLAVDEKVTRKVNFPYDQPIYRDLIPLTTVQQSQPVIPSRGPIPQKDKEPILSNFIESRKSPTYYCLPKVKLENRGMLIGCNSLRVYHNMDKDLS